MKHYDDLIERLRKGTALPVLQALMNEAADAIADLLVLNALADNKIARLEQRINRQEADHE